MLQVEVDLRQIRDNFSRLLEKTSSRVMAVIKADAYGHGLEELASTLVQSGSRELAVGTVAEGVSLRQSQPGAMIYSLLGPLEEQDYSDLFVHGIVPFVHTWEQLKSCQAFAAQANQRLKVALKLETGMNRLGFRAQDIGHLLDFMDGSPGLGLEMVASHLALADDSSRADMVYNQLRNFQDCCTAFRDRGYSFQRSLANSAALLRYPETHLDCVRPGITLYGDNPFRGTDWENTGKGLKQAMHVSAPVMAVYELKKGNGVSYGLSFTAPRDMRIAVVACGYADNYSRGLSNQGWMFFKGNRLPVLGRVCMQLCVVDVSHVGEVVPGDRVYVLGGKAAQGISAREIAEWWGTITYEVFCLLGSNPRVYI